MRRFAETEDVRLKVIKWCANEGHYECETESGYIERVDLMTDNSSIAISPESLVGKIVACEYVYPYISIAVGVTVKEDADE